MKLALHFLFSTVLLVGLSASAAGESRRVNCDVLLAATLSASAVESEALSKLSSPAQTYVRLVNHYIKQVSDQDKLVVLTQILESKDLVNPFANKKDSLSVQVSNAFKSVYAKITSRDWSRIQKVIQEIAQNEKVDGADRDEKRAQTSLVFAPKVVDELDISGFSNDSVKSHIIGKRIFVTAEANSELYLYEFDGKKAVELTRTYMPMLGSLADVQSVAIGQQIFFSFTSVDGDFFLYKLEGKELVESNRIKLKEEGERNYSFKKVGQDTVLVLAAGRSVYLYDVVGGKLKVQSKVSLKLPASTKPHFYTVDKKHYISIGAYNSESFKDLIQLYLIELQDKKLIISDKKQVTDPYEEDSIFPAYTQIRGKRPLLRVGLGTDLKNHFYEIENGLLKELIAPKKEEIENSIESRQASSRNSDLVIANYDNRNLIFELKGSQLVQIGVFGGEQFFDALPYTIQGRKFVATVTDNGFNFYEFIDGLIVEQNFKNTKATGFEYGEGWIEKNGEVFFVLQTQVGFKILRVFSPLK